MEDLRCTIYSVSTAELQYEYYLSNKDKRLTSYEDIFRKWTCQVRQTRFLVRECSIAVLPDTCPGDMAVRMRTEMATPRIWCNVWHLAL